MSSILEIMNFEYMCQTDFQICEKANTKQFSFNLNFV